MTKTFRISADRRNPGAACVRSDNSAVSRFVSSIAGYCVEISETAVRIRNDEAEKIAGKLVASGWERI